MKSDPVIQVFEHEVLRVRKHGFQQRHLDTLIYFNEQGKNRYFTPVYQGLKFSSYVGVIQVGNLVIEILPKADRPQQQANQAIWRSVLLHMLKFCGQLPVYESTETQLALERLHLLDLYRLLFIVEVERLIHQGLIKQYRNTTGQQLALKGRLDFAGQIAHNLVHRERFYTHHQTYDSQHLLHQILRQALIVCQATALNRALAERVMPLLLSLPEMAPLPVSPELFDKINYSRKTADYRRAIELARMLLLHYNPGLQHGRLPILSLLFDMNQLFESYITRQLQRLQIPGLQVERKRRCNFYQRQVLEPDILLTYRGERIVADTKWKVLSSPPKADIHDLRQIYAYHHYFGARRSFLIYPAALCSDTASGKFHIPKENSFTADLIFVDIEKAIGSPGMVGETLLKLMGLS